MPAVADKASTSPIQTPQLPHGRVMVFGMRGDALVHVKDVANGLTCGCLCPACREPLIAVNRGTQKIAHFRHISGAECASGYETALHLAGKAALLRLKRVALPGYSGTLYRQASDGKIFEEPIAGDGPSLLEADLAQEEVWDDHRFRPDVVLESQGHKLYVEIRVTHAVDEAKRAKIKTKGISAIEIDLSKLSPTVLLDQASFDAYLTTAPEIRTWLHSRKQAKLEAAALRRLEQAIAAYEPQVEGLRAAEQARARRAKEKARQRGDAQRQLRAEAESLRASIRSSLAPHLDQLQRSQDEQRITAREQQLAQRHPMIRVEHYLACGIADLFVRVKGHWAFKATHEQWQAFVLDQLFPAEGAQPRAVDATFIEQAVVTQFEVTSFVRAIYTALAGNPLDTVLTRPEMLALPHPKAVVTRYLQHLATLGVIQRMGERAIFSPLAPTLEQAFQAVQERQAERQQTHDRQVQAANIRQAEYLQRMRQRPTPKMEPEVAERVLAILASERMVYEQHQGRGARCTCCSMTLPASRDEPCPFCQSRAARQPVLIDSERIVVARALLPGLPSVARSLASAPALSNLDALQPLIAKVRGEL